MDTNAPQDLSSTLDDEILELDSVKSFMSVIAQVNDLGETQ